MLQTYIWICRYKKKHWNSNSLVQLASIIIWNCNTTYTNILMNSVLQFTTLHLQFQTAKLNLQDHDKLKLSPSVQQITKITIDKEQAKGYSYYTM